MTTYSFGDIVLIGFPHTDLHGISKRPALVLRLLGKLDADETAAVRTILKNILALA